MLKSMTGFGRGEFTDEKCRVVVEIKTVNHRYSDINIRMPRRYSFVEDKLKSVIKKYVKRGKADVSVMVENIKESDITIKLNEPILKQYIENFDKLKEDFGIKDEISFRLLAELPEIFKQIPEIDDEEEVVKRIIEPAIEAGKNLDDMRIIEGEKLSEDLLYRGDIIKGLVDKIEKKSETVPIEYTKKLKDRIEELLNNSVEIPEDRILLEAAIFADKCNITEELIRLNSHMDQMKYIIQSGIGTEGKKLDFLVQEMNREANTIGSKANEIEITNLVLQIKAEIEKIREQVQNIQ